MHTNSRQDSYLVKNGILSYSAAGPTAFVMTRVSMEWVNNIPSDMVPDESYFLSNAWEKRLRAADEDLENGRFKDFKTIDDVISFLNAKTKAKAE